MPISRAPILIAALALPMLAVQAQQGPRGGARTSSGTTSVTSVTIQQRIIIRVPKLPPPRAARAGAAMTPAPRWEEKKADKCVALIDIAAASVGERDSVDLILNGGRRLRAKLGSECRGLDFYSGFYMRMTPDGKACASRDAFRARSGGECRIKAFRKLVEKR